MKPQINSRLKRSLTLLAFLMLAAALSGPQVFAAVTDTDAGDSISNTATIVYEVGGADQSAVNSNTVTFVVDHKVRPLAVQVADSATANNATNAYLAFTVTNDGNTDTNTPPASPDELAIRLTAEEELATDNFNVAANSIRIYQENSSPANTTFEAAEDTLVTDYDLASPTFGTISLARDQQTRIYVVADMPNGQANGNTAVVHLIATAWDTPGQDVGAALGEDTDGDDAGTMEVVWADDQSTLPTGDNGLGAIPSPPDGKHAALATFTISATTLDVTKTSSVESDPFGNVSPNAYRVPGARVQYDILVENTGTVAADNVRVVDRIPAGTDYINGSFTPAAPGATIAYTNDTTTVPPALPTDWTYGPTWDANGVDANITWIRITLANPVAAGGSVTSTFDVFIR